MKILIVGSIFFVEKFKEAKKILEQKGHEVIVPEKIPLPEPIPPDAKRGAMNKCSKDLRKADAVLVMNYNKGDKENYIGVNTLMEIGMAFVLDKSIYLLNPSPESCKDEIEAIGSKVLNGDLRKIT